MNAQTEASPEKEIPDPTTPRNRTWSVEIFYKNGGMDRETVKCVDREGAYSVVNVEGIMMVRVDGEGALVQAALTEVQKTRVSKGA